MQSLSLQAQARQIQAQHNPPRSIPPRPAPTLHPEMIEAVLEPAAEDQGLSLTVKPSDAPFCDVHLTLNGDICPDPLVAMLQMGSALAELSRRQPGVEGGRVSFSGESPEAGTTWIGFIDLEEFEPVAEPSPLLGSVDEIERFITDRSSWFTPQVRETPRLHDFAQRSQQPRIRETAGAIALLLQPQEQLLDVLPVRYQRKSASLILTERRLLCLGQALFRQDANAQLDLKLAEIAYIALAPNGLVIRQQQTEHRLYFSTADIDSLEILLSYFTPVVRRDVLPETVSKTQQTALRGGLVASLLVGAGLTVSGTTDFLLDQTSQQAARLESDSVAQLVPPVVPPTESQICIEQFNQTLGTQGYAALNRASKTMLISLERFAGGYTNGLQFDAIANQIATEVFAACNGQTVEQVRVEDGHYSFFKRKPGQP